MKNTQQRILRHLGQHRQASPAALAQALGLTGADIRYHLTIMIRDGQVERAPALQEERRGRGRPVQVYQLAGAAQKSAAIPLAAALLDVLLENGIPLTQVAQRLANPPAGPPGQTQRLNQAMLHLNELHHQAAWEATPGGPRVYFRHCPFAALLPRYPQLCQIDCALLSHLVGKPFTQQARINLTGSSPAACIFTLAPAISD